MLVVGQSMASYGLMIRLNDGWAYRELLLELVV